MNLYFINLTKLPQERRRNIALYFNVEETDSLLVRFPQIREGDIIEMNQNKTWTYDHPSWLNMKPSGTINGSVVNGNTVSGNPSFVFPTPSTNMMWKNELPHQEFVLVIGGSIHPFYWEIVGQEFVLLSDNLRSTLNKMDFVQRGNFEFTSRKIKFGKQKFYFLRHIDLSNPKKYYGYGKPHIEGRDKRVFLY
jgi:hypothetical protein